MNKFDVGLRMSAAILAVSFAGCASGPMSAREQGALGGAAVGATSGAIIGSASGDSAEGALIGGALGAITGAIVGDSVDAQRQRMQRDEALTNELRERNLDAYRTDRGVVVNIPDVLFEFGRAELTPGAYRKISGIADVLASPGVAWRRVSVEGHTDSIGSTESNQRLSERRADAVANALSRQGVAPARLSTHGFGEAYPVAANVHGDGSDNPAGRARNRRVEVVILDEQGDSSRPGPQPARQYESADPNDEPGYPEPAPYPSRPAGPPPGYPSAPPGYPPGPPPPYGY
ncbi:MAG TPA: OmpA family protein [Candidatus Limnocylindrales bacterium]|nr:OmpA family protein [Candidatus Limnocylindrales bacterium]